MVGGYAAPIKTIDNKTMLVDDDGLLRGRPVNLLASNMAGFGIVGDALVVPRGMRW
jgi:hypothetical protein